MVETVAVATMSDDEDERREGKGVKGRCVSFHRVSRLPVCSVRTDCSEHS